MYTAANAVSRPITPFGAASNGTSFSCARCGAWSVAMQSSVPSASASISAARSAAERNGGFILLTAGSSSRTSSSVRHRWCGETSAVTSTPSSLARRISATDSAAEMWQRCSGAPS